MNVEDGGQAFGVGGNSFDAALLAQQLQNGMGMGLGIGMCSGTNGQQLALLTSDLGNIGTSVANGTTLLQPATTLKLSVSQFTMFSFLSYFRIFVFIVRKIKSFNCSKRG